MLPPAPLSGENKLLSTSVEAAEDKCGFVSNFRRSISSSNSFQERRKNDEDRDSGDSFPSERISSYDEPVNVVFRTEEEEDDSTLVHITAEVHPEPVVGNSLAVVEARGKRRKIRVRRGKQGPNWAPIVLNWRPLEKKVFFSLAEKWARRFDQELSSAQRRLRDRGPQLRGGGGEGRPVL